MSDAPGAQGDLPATSEPDRRSRKVVTLIAIAAAVIIISSIAYALAGTVGTTDSQRPGGGNDGHSVLEVDSSVVVQTEAKAIVQVRIRSVEPTGLAFTATVAGLPDGETGTWTALLDNGGELPLNAEAHEDSLVSVWLEGEVRAGRTVDQVRLDPDASAGDVYFAIEK